MKYSGFSGLKRSNFQHYSHTMGLCFTIFISFFLMSCGSIENLYGDKKPTSNARKSTLTKNVDVTELRQLARPPEFGESANSNGLRITDGQFLNLNTKTRLFSESLRDEDDRFDRLEGAVQQIRDDFDSMSPAINRLIAIESDIKELHNQLSLLIKNEQAIEAPVQNKAATLKNKAKAIQSAKAQQVQKNSVAPTIRVADYVNKTRIVFETKKKYNYQVNFDSDLQIIVVDTGFTPSSQITSRAVRQSKHIKDITKPAQSNGQSSIAIAVKDIKKISPGSYIGPSAANQNHRYYFDLFL